MTPPGPPTPSSAMAPQGAKCVGSPHVSMGSPFASHTVRPRLLLNCHGFQAVDSVSERGRPRPLFLCGSATLRDPFLNAKITKNVSVAPQVSVARTLVRAQRSPRTTLSRRLGSVRSQMFVARSIIATSEAALPPTRNADALVRNGSARSQMCR